MSNDKTVVHSIEEPDDAPNPFAKAYSILNFYYSFIHKNIGFSESELPRKDGEDNQAYQKRIVAYLMFAIVHLLQKNTNHSFEQAMLDAKKLSAKDFYKKYYFYPTLESNPEIKFPVGAKRDKDALPDRDYILANLSAGLTRDIISSALLGRLEKYKDKVRPTIKDWNEEWEKEKANYEKVSRLALDLFFNTHPMYEAVYKILANNFGKAFEEVERRKTK